MFLNFDYTATTPVRPEVMDHLHAMMRETAGNPASAHELGNSARELIDQARDLIARTLECLPENIIFTSGATEATNTALKGAALTSGSRPRTLLTTKGEHEATHEVAEFLSRYANYDVTYLDLTDEGTVDMDMLDHVLDTGAPGLASFIYVSNETGAINPLREIVHRIRAASERTILHADVVQAIGKLPFSFLDSGLDFASVAGHKCGAPKGTGLLLVRKGVHFEPLLHGGGQQSRRRSGTESGPLAMALAEAIHLSVQEASEQYEYVVGLKQRFIDGLTARTIPFQLISPKKNVSPYVLSLSFPGLRGETLLHALSAEQIYISTGSACGSAHAGENAVLESMGLPRDVILNSCRWSFHPGLTPDDIDYACARTADIYRRFSRM